MIQLIARSRALHFAIVKTKVGIQEVISPYSFDEIVILSTPWMQKLILKRRKARDSRIEMSKQIDYSKHSRMVYIVEEHAYI